MTWHDRQRAALDAPNAAGNAGCIGLARHRNEYLPGALCETEPEVRAFWLSCIQEMLDIGVDGRFSGFIVCETATYLRMGPAGDCTLAHDAVAEISRRAREGGQ